ncbi:hypothetical protein CFTD6783_08405 [Campylobacter fetus subsp. testudinum]|uniref:hypothetical protein n=1 Tax=Campylobacter fetus TaxID=196 RepID=UPI000818B80F|nr:hypothetical protein [Campylobacter fetus]OCS09378.1 hypothetical protein CFTD6783_08405 [Campylobacter fetus subsp. testudinum]
MKTAKKRKVLITLLNLDNILVEVGKDLYDEENRTGIAYSSMFDYELGDTFEYGTTLETLKVGDIGEHSDIEGDCVIEMKVIELAEHEFDVLVEIKVPKELEDYF